MSLVGVFARAHSPRAAVLRSRQHGGTYGYGGANIPRVAGAPQGNRAKEGAHLGMHRPWTTFDSTRRRRRYCTPCSRCCWSSSPCRCGLCSHFAGARTFGTCVEIGITQKSRRAAAGMCFRPWSCAVCCRRRLRGGHVWLQAGVHAFCKHAGRGSAGRSLATHGAQSAESSGTASSALTVCMHDTCGGDAEGAGGARGSSARPSARNVGGVGNFHFHGFP